MCVQYAFVVLVAFAAIVRVDGYLDVLSNVHDCGSADLDTCLKSQLSRTIDEILDKNDTYRLNRYLTVTTVGNHRRSPSTSDDLGAKFLNLFNSLQIQYRPEEEHGSTDNVSEGRKKKIGKYKKHKMGMMMGFTAMGMSILGGLFNKMMMGGAISIALKALIISKIALVLAGTMAVKKLLSGGGIGQISYHPSWTGGGGGGGNEQHSGYRRSYAAQQPKMTTADALPYRDQIDSYSNANYSR
ncbi:uncharacterized protein LOC132921114 [Rhopalosiphum padi]|uniref:uncharacterized protein LOC132921114 n=1 Tax=Rhopalosiphum padi TaxID=40932 RepID=UPI00298DF957|nr:uncharacterized protein LOC132921114 [Rhopalosiphum padi]